MTRVHVVGAAGYAATEFIRLASQHPFLTLGALESASHAGQPIAASVPALRHMERAFDPPGTLEATLAPGDAVILAGGADLARLQAPALIARGALVIDFSDAFRMTATPTRTLTASPTGTLPATQTLTAVYGLPERYRAALGSARLVANPGCYPTATLLALLPLAEFAADIVQIVVDATSGVTGAGRSPATANLFGEVDGDVRAYGLAGHRHEPEIAQELQAAGIAAPFVFTPHVVPIKRGMLANCYALLGRDVEASAVNAAFARAYDGNAFVRVLPAERAPSVVAVAGTSDAELHVSIHGRVVRVIAAIDNLGKGAAGQAMQNLNLMLGLPEETSLRDRTVGV